MLHCLSRTDVYVMDSWTGMMTRDIPSLVSLKGLAGCDGGVQVRLRQVHLAVCELFLHLRSRRSQQDDCCLWSPCVLEECSCI